MEEIINIVSRRFGDTEVNAVDAREVHEALGVGRDFSTWIKGRIEELSLVIHEDFEVFTESGENAGRPRTQYVVSLDAAKHLAMAERNDAGRRVRAYFIAAEKNLRSRSIGFDLRDPAQRLVALHQTLELLNESEAKVEALTAEVETKSQALAIVTPKADIFDAFIDSNGLYLLMNAARALHQPPKLFIAALKVAKILGYQNGELVARAHYTDAKDSNGVPLGKGYFTHRPYTFDRSGGVKDSRTQVFVTPLGLAWLGRAVSSGRLVIRSNSERARKAVA